MPTYLVSAKGKVPSSVDAPNWLMALGMGLDSLGIVAELDRLACEVLPNGTVIARDVRTGGGYVVQPVAMDGSATPATSGATTARRAPSLSLSDEPMALGAEEPTEESPLPELDLTSALEALEEADPERMLPGGDASPLEDQSVLGRIDQVNAAPSDVVAWQMSLDIAQGLIPCESGAAIRREGEDGMRFVGATGPMAHRVAAVRLPRGTGIAGFCMDRVVSLVVREPQHDPRFFGTMDELTGYATRSVLCVPVAFEDRIYGCIELLNASTERPFSRADLDLLELLAGTLADRLSARP